jgi:hypothetical protein
VDDAAVGVDRNPDRLVADGDGADDAEITARYG